MASARIMQKGGKKKKTNKNHLLTTKQNRYKEQCKQTNRNVEKVLSEEKTDLFLS